MSTNQQLKDLIKHAFREWEEEHAFPPEVHFKRHHLPPSGWEYLGPDDHLQVNIYTTATTSGLTLALRQLMPDGRITYTEESLDGVSLSTLTTKRFQLSEGFLVGASISNLGGGLADQVCFVNLALQRGFQTSTKPHTVLAQGYVSNLFTVDWPPVYVRGPAPGGVIVKSFSSVDASADVPQTTLYTPTNDGLFRMSAYGVITQAAAVSSTLGNAFITWTDAETGVINGGLLGGTFSTNVLGDSYANQGTTKYGDGFVRAKGGSNIQFRTAGYASSGAPGMLFSVWVKLEDMGI